MKTFELAYLSNPEYIEADTKVVQDAFEAYPIKFQALRTIENIFSSLSDVNFYADYLCIDLKYLKSVKGVHSVELLTTIKTLISCTVCREFTGFGVKTQKRKTKVICIVSETDDPKDIRAIDKVVDGLAPRVGETWTHKMVHEYIGNHLINEDMSMPKMIQEYLKNSNKVIKLKFKKDDINLTPRQEQIHALISSRGASNKVIARTLNISESTVKLHVSAILKKYGVKNRTQLVVFSPKETTEVS
jgi:DNA-binding NarL/FixJ family response regulator